LETGALVVKMAGKDLGAAAVAAIAAADNKRLRLAAYGFSCFDWVL